MKKLILLAVVALSTTAFATNATTFDTHVVAKPLTYSPIDGVRQVAGYANPTCDAYAKERCQDKTGGDYKKCVADDKKYEC